MSENKKKYALCVEYFGAQFYGWQRQANVPSIQESLELALSKIANEPVSVQCSGRTDSGVHATYQIVHFSTHAERDEKAWVLGINSNLPDPIAIKWVKPVDDNFHARFTATARRYRYVIYNDRTRPGILNKGVTQIYKPLNADLMDRAAQCLVGEHDFSAFRAAHCQSNTPWRNIHHVHVTRQGKYIVMDIKANAFLHHMVRNIIGSLAVIGAGEESVTWMQTLLDSKDRTLAAATAKPDGLYFVDVDFPAQYGFPPSELGPIFLNLD